MNQGGDAAETMFRIVLQGTEVMLKLTGSGAKNLAAILYRYSQGDRKLKGATNLNKLLKSGKELTIVRINQSELKEFKYLSKKYGILFSAVKDTRTKDGMCDVFFKKEDYAKVEHIVGKMELTGLSHEKVPTFNNPDKDHEKTKDENGNEILKKDSQQRRDSSMPNSKSQTKRNTADTPRIINDIKTGNKESFTPDNWKQFLIINSSMYAYSQGNQNRIIEQASNASVVMSKTKWRELGRYPQHGAKGIKITIPEYKNGTHTGNYIDAKVYDISETYGRDNPQHSILLSNGSQEIKSEISRIKDTAPVPVVINDKIATDSFYNPEDKKIYLRSDITESEVYIGLAKETAYANAHIKQGKAYSSLKTTLWGSIHPHRL